MLKKEKIEFFIAKLQEMFPHARCELDYETPFQLLVAVILSAQTTDKQVNKVNQTFFKILKNPIDTQKIWLSEIEKNIKSIWLYKNKAKFVFETGKYLIDNFDSKIPENIIDLQKLPWVGIKTAKVVMAVLFNWPYLAVDTHVHRVLNRLWFVHTKDASATDKQAEKIFSNNDKSRLHHLLIFFWRYHCTARNPKCETCPLISICKFKNK